MCNSKKGISFANLTKSTFFKFCALLVLLSAVLITVFIAGQKSTEPTENEPYIVTETSLKEIISASSISTFEAVYNGIAEVYNEKKPLEVDCYVSYNATVKAGFDLKAVKLMLNEETKQITVTIPQISITEINIDETSLEYIFYNPDINKSGIFSIAMKACQDDADRACRYQSGIFEFAGINARSYMEALITPFLDTLNEDYALIINLEEKER